MASCGKVVEFDIMIYLYSGTPGSGKSCHQAEDILDYIRYNEACIIANYEVNEDLLYKHAHKSAKFYHLDNEEITPEYLINFSKIFFTDHKFREGKIRLYIDEAQILFNCREWDMKGRKEWIKFFTQHRKYGYDIYLISQFDRMIDRQIRSLIEYEYKHRKLNNAGGKGKIMSIVLGGNTYLSIKYWYPMQEKLGAEIHHIRKRFYNLYDSYKDFSDNFSISINSDINNIVEREVKKLSY